MPYNYRMDNRKNLAAATFKEINDAETENIVKVTQILKEELGFYHRAALLYAEAIEEVPDDLIVCASLFFDSKRELTYSVMSILRGHMTKAAGSIRNSIEALAFATIIFHDPSLTELYMDASNQKKKFKEAFELKKWESSPLVKKLEGMWKRTSDLGSHASFVSQIFRRQLKDQRLTDSYFDIPDEGFEMWTRQIFNYVIAANILILEAYGETFANQIMNPTDWKSKLTSLREDHSNHYKQTRTSFPLI